MPSLWLAQEAGRWAKTKRGTPKDTRCAACAQVSKAFPTESWESLCAKAGTNAEFGHLVAECRRVVLGEKEKTFLSQAVDSEQRLEVAVSKQYLFISEPDFRTRYGVDGQKLHLPSEYLKNEVGVWVKGFVLQDPADAGPFRKITVTCRSGHGVSTALMNRDQQLYQDQAEQTMAWIHEATSREREG